MGTIIEKIVKSSYPPDNINVLWLKEESSGNTLYAFGDLGWEKVAQTDQEIQDILAEMNAAAAQTALDRIATGQDAQTATDKAQIATDKAAQVVTDKNYTAGYAEDALQAKIDAEAAKSIVQANSVYMGPLAYNASAPTPEKNCYYEFVSSGIKPVWLTGSITNVAIGDRAIVVYHNSAYTYTYQANPNTNIVQEAGVGTNVVMSQKAVTEIANITGRRIADLTGSLVQKSYILDFLKNGNIIEITVTSAAPVNLSFYTKDASEANIQTLGVITESNVAKNFVLTADAEKLYYYNSNGAVSIAFSVRLKGLEDELSDLSAKVDGNYLKQVKYNGFITNPNDNLIDCALSGANWAVSSDQNKSIIIPVKEGHWIQLVGGQSDTRYGFITSFNAIPVNNDAIPYVSGTTNSFLNANSSANIPAPASASYLIVNMKYGNVACVPASIFVNGISVLDSLRDAQGLLAFNQKIDNNAIFNPNGSAFNIYDGGAGWLISDNNKTMVLPIKQGDSIFLKAGTGYSVYSFLSTFNRPKNGDSVTYLAGTGRTLLAAGLSRGIIVPTGAKYFTICLLSQGSNWSPDILTINGISVLYNLRDSISDLYIDRLEVAKGRTNESSLANILEVVDYDSIANGQRRKFAPKMIVAVNHDDLNDSDWLSIRKIYNKYGFNANFNLILKPFSSADDQVRKIDGIRKLIKDGNDIGIHAFFNSSYWWLNKMYDINPSGTALFAPLLASLKGSNGDGTGVNDFGDVITTSTTFASIGYTGAPLSSVKVVEATPNDWKSVIKAYCVYYNSDTITGLDLQGVSITKTRIGWAEYWYNNLIDSSLGYSSVLSDEVTMLTADYMVPSGASIADYYPDASHIESGKIVFYDDTANTHYNDSDYQKVGRFSKGLFKGCASCCNYEVQGRIIDVAQAFCRHYFGMDHFTCQGVHGENYNEKCWMDGSVPYDNINKSILHTTASKLYYTSIGIHQTVYELLKTRGIKTALLESLKYPVIYEGQIGMYNGSDGFHHPNINALNGAYGYTTMFGATLSTNNEVMTWPAFISFANKYQSRDWLKWAYEQAGNQVSDGAGNYHYMLPNVKGYVDKIRSCIGTGKIPQISFDTNAITANIFAGFECICQFCYANDITLVPIETARQIALNDNNTLTNMFPNPGFNRALINMWGDSTSNDAHIPDGWIVNNDCLCSVESEVIEGVKRRVLAVTGNSVTNLKCQIYGLPDGKYNFSAYVKSQNINYSCFFIGKKYNSDLVSSDPESWILDVSPNSTYQLVTVEFEIETPYYEAPTDIPNMYSGGYGNNVSHLLIQIGVEAGKTTSLFNPRISRIN